MAPDPALRDKVQREHVKWTIDATYPSYTPGQQDFAKAVLATIESFAKAHGIELPSQDAVRAANEA